MQKITVVGLCYFLVACAGTGSPHGDVAAPPTVAVPSSEIVEVDLVAASGPKLVCKKVVRPGTRMVVGETCAPQPAPGVSVQTREEIQREISGQGWSSGWKTDAQIEAERRVSFGPR